MAHLINNWNSRYCEGVSSLGAVVGATDTAALAEIRCVLADSWILCPGVGSQGGILEVSNTLPRTTLDLILYVLSECVQGRVAQ